MVSEYSSEPAVKREAVSEINHSLDEQDITRIPESGMACVPVNGRGVEGHDVAKKPDLEGSSGADKGETRDECEIDLTVCGTVCALHEGSDEMQKTNKTRKEIVEEGNITTREAAENLDERSGVNEAVEEIDGVDKAAGASEYGVQEDSAGTGNIVNDKHNEETPAVVEMYCEDNDDYLLYLKEILCRIHQRFYEIFSRCRNTAGRRVDAGVRCVEDPPDLRSIVPELRRSVLKGTNVVFTGVIPTNCRHEESQAWKIATQFGAGVTRDLMRKKNTVDKSRRTTHVIAARPGTEKACQASRLPNVKLVNPNWLWTCAERWEWVDERLFPVEESEKQKTDMDESPPLSRKGTPKPYSVCEGSTSTYTPGGGSSWDGGTSSRDEFRESWNPLLRFSTGEVEAMDKEVEDLMRSSDDEEDCEILGSVSSSSGSTENGQNSAASDESLRMETDGVLDEAEELIIKGKAVNFSTIKQATTKRVLFCSTDVVKAPLKRARTDGGANADVASESSNEGSSATSSDEDGDDNDMAAMLEAALYHS